MDVLQFEESRRMHRNFPLSVKRKNPAPFRVSAGVAVTILHSADKACNTIEIQNKMLEAVELIVIYYIRLDI